MNVQGEGFRVVLLLHRLVVSCSQFVESSADGCRAFADDHLAKKYGPFEHAPTLDGSALHM